MSEICKSLLTASGHLLQLNKLIWYGVLVVVGALGEVAHAKPNAEPASKAIVLVPFANTLKITVPATWTYVAASPEAVRMGLEAAGYQGGLKPGPSLHFEHQLYEVNVYAFARNSALAADKQLDLVLTTLDPQVKEAAVRKTADEKETGGKLGVYRTLETPYGASAITTFLYAVSGDKSIVVIEGVMSGRASGNSTLAGVRSLIPQVQVRL